MWILIPAGLSQPGFLFAHDQKLAGILQKFKSRDSYFEIEFATVGVMEQHIHERRLPASEVCNRIDSDFFGSDSCQFQDSGFMKLIVEQLVIQEQKVRYQRD